MDPAEAPAAELAFAYAQRWEIELAFAELKTHQRGSKAVLRSKSPALVEQEIWGHLSCHYAIRNLMFEAAHDADVDPDRVSWLRRWLLRVDARGFQSRRMSTTATTAIAAVTSAIAAVPRRSGDRNGNWPLSLDRIAIGGAARHMSRRERGPAVSKMGSTYPMTLSIGPTSARLLGLGRGRPFATAAIASLSRRVSLAQ